MLSLRQQRRIGTLCKIGAELVCLVLLAWVLARIFWLLLAGAPVMTQADGIKMPRFAPRDTVTKKQTRNSAILIEKNYFKDLGFNVPSEEIPETRLNLRLKMVRGGGANVSKSAVIRTPDNKEKTYAQGDEIVNGVQLVEVGNDRVILTKNGEQEVLIMESKTSVITRKVDIAAPPPEAVAPPPPTDAQVIELPFAAITAVEIDASNPSQGLLIKSRDSGAASLKQFGVEDGDRIISINGKPASELDQQSFLQAFLTGKVFTIEINRNGDIITQQMKRVDEG